MDCQSTANYVKVNALRSPGPSSPAESATTDQATPRRGVRADRNCAAFWKPRIHFHAWFRASELRHHRARCGVEDDGQPLSSEGEACSGNPQTEGVVTSRRELLLQRPAAADTALAVVGHSLA
jgi:hypothetical protein